MNWDDCRLFFACAEAGSLRKAAIELGVDSATVTRRMDRLEEQLGHRLLVRYKNGVKLTPFGLSVFEEVASMMRATQNISRLSHAGDLRGLIRLAVTEGLGTYWILPKLIDWQRANNLLTIDFRASMQEADVSRLEADIAIQFHRPAAADLKIVKLGRLHTYPFVSADYRNRFGVPKSLAEAVEHRFVEQASPLLDEEVMKRALSVDDLSGIVGIRTNASSAVLYAVELGAGIGVLPSYALNFCPQLVPVDMGVEYSLDIFMIYHPDLKKSERHMRVIEWLKRIFDPRFYPCFRDEFIHPVDLMRSMGDTGRTARERIYSAINFGASHLTGTSLRPAPRVAVASVDEEPIE
ncbi:MAG: LysR family transcriptional regulator [Methylocystis sp.]|uniref:LysR family transcriptional regulator n=1 Tax=Methylocystis sp. TaxID=1911079 RepID=UPI003DA5A4FF